jgi:hypothetical protein
MASSRCNTCMVKFDKCFHYNEKTKKHDIPTPCPVCELRKEVNYKLDLDHLRLLKLEGEKHESRDTK